MVTNDFASKLNDNSDMTLNRVPVDVALGALQSQVDELKRLVALLQQKNGVTDVSHATPAPIDGNEDSNVIEELRARIQELEKQNAKSEYRIEFLLRALDARDKA
ncbi:hypothetical protein BX666DRAFT_586060 [Dichotomocladium elegans]|nr:hypothetical protein BX666DRAFT_586060 [Dichotomocladium elegans]